MTVILVAAAILIASVLILRSVVTEKFGGSDAEVLSYEAVRDTISTTVSGSGSLLGVDAESIVLPAGVEVTEVVVRTGRAVSKGDVLSSTVWNGCLESRCESTRCTSSDIHALRVIGEKGL